MHKFKIGDRVKVVKLMYTDTDNTNLNVGATGTVVKVSVTAPECLDVRFDTDFKHDSCNWNDKLKAYTMFAEQLEYVTQTSDSVYIYREGKKTIAIRPSNGDIGIAYCHPDDEFNLDIGASIAMKRLNMLKLYVGNRVRVIDSQCAVTTAYTWIKSHIHNPVEALKYDFGHYPEQGAEAVVILIDNDNEVLIELDGRYYVIDIEGLERIE